MREVGANAGTEFQRPAKPPMRGKLFCPPHEKRLYLRNSFSSSSATDPPQPELNQIT